MFDDIEFYWEDRKDKEEYYLKETGEEPWGQNAFLVKIVPNDKMVWEEPKWIAYLNHDYLAQLMFPTDGIRTRIELMMLVLPDNILDAKKDIEGQIKYSFRKRNITYHKTRQQKIDEQLDED